MCNLISDVKNLSEHKRANSITINKKQAEAVETLEELQMSTTRVLESVNTAIICSALTNLAPVKEWQMLKEKVCDVLRAVSHVDDAPYRWSEVMCLTLNFFGLHAELCVAENQPCIYV